jgi:hypothetical protein
VALGAPFNPDGKGARRAEVLYCPNCLSTGRHTILDPKMITEPIPERMEPVDTPYCIYSCAVKTCLYAEIHWYMRMRKT